METISRCLLTFLVNSFWQIPLVAAVTALACRLMKTGPASYAPSGIVSSPEPTPSATRPDPTRAQAANIRTVPFGQTTAAILVGAYCLFLLFRFGKLAWASARTVQI